MKYFIDFEFIEGFRKPLFGKKHHFINPISVGIYSETGESYYQIFSDYNYKEASEWVKEKVIRPLYIDIVHGDSRNMMDDSNFHKHKGLPKQIIAGCILDFFGCWRDQHFWRAPEGIEIYGYYADYDWVLLCSLFGRMSDLPKGFPMYCIDLKQMVDGKARDYVKDPNMAVHSMINAIEWVKNQNGYPKQENEHNALADAKWNYELYKFLTK